MTDGIYKSFSAATCDVLKLMFNLEAESCKLDEMDSNLNDGIFIIIGLCGNLNGEVNFLISKNTAIKLIRILSGMDFDEIDDFVTSAIGEVGNIISGNALAKLFEQQIICDILPPQIKIDSLDLPKSQKVYRVCTEAGNIDFWVKI
ncbi:MAG TPA: chemotaxis protein CheX [Clostridiales bacterium]|nr:chemotaxis protein CheX [Clostridiales bacterium]